MRDAASAIDWLCNPASQVSCHYVVVEDGAVLQLVDEERRAWHAGRSFWQGETDLNSASIGIEIVNGGHDFGLPPFPGAQIDALVALCRDIIRRHSIRAERILAHSDIAPSRKRDPGERFPWKRLAEAGVGLWPDVPAKTNIGLPSILLAADVQARLCRIGYGLTCSGAYDDETTAVLRAFQRRYRPQIVDGVADLDTVSRIDAVLALHSLNLSETPEALRASPQDSLQP